MKPLREISAIDVEIKRIEGILHSLKQKRADLQQSMDDCNTILAPVRRLPMDVLSIIFTYSLATHRNPIMSPSEAPILLTHICHDWRSISLSIPRLWSRLHIPLLLKTSEPLFGQVAPPRQDAERREARSEEVQRWLTLSASRPLSIMITSTGSVSSYHRPPMDAILRSSRRWQELELGYIAPQSNLSQKMLDFTTYDLCLLQELRVHSIPNPQDTWLESCLFNAPGLRSISIATMPETTSYMPVNWKNLNRLFIHSPIMLELVTQILNHCRNLVACLLEVQEPAWGWNPELAPELSSFLPHLKFLSLRGDSTACNHLYSNIRAPSLRVFRGTFAWLGLFNLLRSIHSLETLMMDHPPVSDDVFEFYTLIPSLTRLFLGQPSQPLTEPDTPSWVTDLYTIRHPSTPDSAPTVLLPSLEVFEAFGIKWVNDEQFLKFIINRIYVAKSNTSVSKLRRVSVQFSRSRQMDIVPEALAYAREAGIELELDLKYCPGNVWSPSFGLVDDVSWAYPSYAY